MAFDSREATHERLAVQLLELVEAGAVHDPSDDLARVELVAEVFGHQAVQVGGVELGRLRRCQCQGLWSGGSRCRTISLQIASACSSEVA